MDRSRLYFWGVILVIFLVLVYLSGCQNRDQNTYNITAYSGGRVDVHPSGETMQDRGEQSDLGVRARVDARDNTVEGVPGIAP